jgi:hypothetical protein
VREDGRAGHERPVAASVAAPEKLVTTADCKHRDAPFLRGSEALALRRQIGGDERLLSILATTDVQEVVCGRIELVGQSDRPNVQLVTAQRGPAGEHGQIAAVGIDVEVPGVQVPNADPHASASQ